MDFSSMIWSGLAFGFTSTSYLLVIMIATNPRVWGYADYPDRIKRIIPPQTKKEKLLALLVGLPWLLFVLLFPIYSTLSLKTNLGGNITFVMAFMNIFVLYAFANLGDVILLDWLIVSKITPKFVIISGTNKNDYKDFSHHFKAHLRALLPTIVFQAAVAAFIAFT